MDDLLQEFIAETRETLEALSGEIVAWESAPDNRERLDAIFRFVHTVKGSCGFLNLPRLGRLSHAAEDALASVREGERAADTALVNAVLAIVDRIAILVDAIDGGVALDDSGEELLIAALAEGAAAAPTTTQTQMQARTSSRSVRLNVDLLDRMMSGMSDMVLARNELARRLRGASVDPVVEAALERLSATVAEMRDTVTRTRMQKIDALFSALPRMVRDTAASVGKSVVLNIEGSDVELDREMIELMRDPLVHIIRNAIDHGIETPSERRTAGKRENGRLTVLARQSGNQIIIEIADDGRGIDVDALIARSVRSGAHTEAELRALGDKAQLDLIFEAGVSTKDVATTLSGRGVGMDVVRTNVEQIGGRIVLKNSPGRGLSILIHVPLTLSIISGIGVRCGDQRFAIPRQTIEEIVRVRGDAIRIDTVGDTPLATVRERCLPLVDLGALLGIRAEGPAGMLAILSVPGGSYALAVDDVLDHEELVIKPSAPAVMATGLYAGQSLPDTGLPMLLLDSAGIAVAAGLTFSRAPEQEDVALEVEAEAPLALLFEDLDGVRRFVPSAVIDRVEPFDADAAQYSAGQLRLSVDGRIIPLAVAGEWTPGGSMQVLRLRDGKTEIGYAIREAIDIIPLPPGIQPAREPGPIAGVVAFGDEQIEVLDLFWLFTHHAAAAPGSRTPLCLLDGDDADWQKNFLKPMIEQAGYRVAFAPAPERPDIALVMDQAVSSAAPGVPVIRLRSDSDERDAPAGSIYRYDRQALLGALAQAQARGGRA